MTVRSPLKWHGGKTWLAPEIISFLPKKPGYSYCEVFGGGGSVMLSKPRSDVEIFNDKDDRLFNFFKAIQDDDRWGRVWEALDRTRYRRTELKIARESVDDPVESARRFFNLYNMSFSGRAESFSTSKTDSARGMASVVSGWQRKIGDLHKVHERLRGVVIENLGWSEIFDQYDCPEMWLYCDPPYPEDVRVDGHYAVEMTLAEHEDFVKRLLGLQGKRIVSGYMHPIYRRLEDFDWERHDFPVVARSSNECTERVERLWISPNALGRGLSARERMQQGLHQLHHLRKQTTERRVRAAISQLKLKGQRVTYPAVAAKVRRTPEHLCRKYKHLFKP
jgi:DNA adenine methylase